MLIKDPGKYEKFRVHNKHELKNMKKGVSIDPTAPYKMY